MVHPGGMPLPKQGSTVCLACFAANFFCTCRTETYDTSLDSSIKGLSFDVPYGLIDHRVVAHLSIAFEAK